MNLSTAARAVVLHKQAVEKRVRLEQIEVMKFASAVTTKADWTEAVEDLTLQIRSQLI
jgi:hypothetical protein